MKIGQQFNYFKESLVLIHLFSGFDTKFAFFLKSNKN